MAGAGGWPFLPPPPKPHPEATGPGSSGAKESRGRQPVAWHVGLQPCCWHRSFLPAAFPGASLSLCVCSPGWLLSGPRRKPGWRKDPQLGPPT